ncbi:MAG TPA: phosphoribosylglycinamide formyltransferase [Rhizomicrobium sp.]|jgi:phosphoribosylglycinamide formyltransferase-1|nr:phosphoribosylglycinamide formyltransferase [Rhizomicrobium sp.]
MPRTKTAVLISGRGSNLQALIDACARADFPAEIALVISNVAEAEGLVRAKAAHIATHVISHKDFASRETFDAAVDTALRTAGIEIVCLAGFMRILSDTFVTAWEGRLINIHPSLLPAFKGTNVHQRTLDAGVTESGCTVHFVVPELDSGPIIAQAKVPVEKNDTVETLAARILAAEHALYPEGLRQVSSGAVKL